MTERLRIVPPGCSPVIDDYESRLFIVSTFYLLRMTDCAQKTTGDARLYDRTEKGDASIDDVTSLR